jgi:virginiamycin B lyase
MTRILQRPCRLPQLLGAAFACCLAARAAPSASQSVITEFLLPGAGSATPGGFTAHSMTAGPDGMLWFSCGSRSTIARMAIDGTLTEFSLPPDSFPAALVVGPDSRIWFLLPGAPQAIGRITTTGQLTQTLVPVAGSSSLAGLVAAQDGNVWFTEATFIGEATGPDPTAVGRMSPTGAITQYSLPLGYSGTAISRSSEGNLWFISSWLSMWGSSSGVERISLNGTRSTVVDTAGLAPCVGSAIALGPDGNGWLTCGQGTVAKVTPAGGVTQFAIPTANSSPFDITAGPDGNLWFTEYKGNKIGRITPQGVITEFSVPTPDSGPAAICVGPDGNIWFTEDKANQVGRLLLPSASCTEDSLVMCLVGGRYKVTSYWRDQYTDGAAASLSQTRLTDAIGAFWLFDEDTFEYLIRINTATDNGRAWISIASFTDVEFWVTVQDTVNGQAQIYHSLPGNRTSIYDPYFFVYP